MGSTENRTTEVVALGRLTLINGPFERSNAPRSGSFRNLSGSSICVHLCSSVVLSRFLLILALLLACEINAASYQVTPATQPPPVLREFRGMWIPSIGESSWLAQTGMTTAQQKAELLALLDQAVQLKLNAVIFQVRPAGDALYKSDIEPWSEYLAGKQGKAPSPFYDPLEFVVTEAHKRGLELHAWFNPFRAGHPSSKSSPAKNAITQKRPDLIRHYGSQVWLDPGEPDARDYSLRVIMDVVRRYDIDGIHIDDYFYPYPEKDAAGRDMEFPDYASWKKFGVNSGLSRNDWRRRNVDQFVERVAIATKAAKPQLKFGISPFGIWRPKNPPGIEGLDAYDKLFADARKWLREGWCDYMAPQLYWPIEQKEQSFPMLLKWWNDQNPKHRYVWPGLNTVKVGAPWKESEITNQIGLIRKADSAPGHIHWSATALLRNTALRSALSRDVYRQPALVPKFGWLDSTPPGRPAASVVIAGGMATISWSASGTEKPTLWVIQSKQFGDWKTQILPGAQTSFSFDLKPDLVAVSAVDRCGNQSSPLVLQLVK